MPKERWEFKQSKKNQKLVLTLQFKIFNIDLTNYMLIKLIDSRRRSVLTHVNRFRSLE